MRQPAILLESFEVCALCFSTSMGRGLLVVSVQQLLPINDRVGLKGLQTHDTVERFSAATIRIVLLLQS